MESNITTISEEQLDALFADTPENTPNAADLPIKQASEESPDIDIIEDIEDLFGEETEKPEEETKTEEKEKSTEEKSKEDKPKEEEKQSEEDEQFVNEGLRNVAKFLISKGQWFDFEGSEEYLDKINPESFEELALKQDEDRLNQSFNDLVDSTGDYGKAIFAHIKQGGNPDDVIDIFKEQKAIQAIDTKSVDGQKAIIEKYYSEVLNWKPEKVRKQIERIIVDDELETEAAEVEEKFNESYKERLAEIQQQEIQRKEDQKRKEQVFVSSITHSLASREDLEATDKANIQKALFTFKNKLPDGTLVNDFYLKFAEIQSKPEEYIDLVDFVLNKDKYKKKLESKGATVEAKRHWNFTRTGGSGKQVESNNSKKQNKQSPINTFSLALQK